MARLLVYYAHPGHKFSRVNKEMAKVAIENKKLTFCDLYREYPRYNINIDAEQEKLLNHDVILFQHPLFWYSTPSLIKEWIDLVLEHGFAFGAGGDKLTGKIMMNALTTAGPEDAYSTKGYQHFTLRTFLTPLEQTARLCHMKYAAPYVLHSSLSTKDQDMIPNHVKGYQTLLNAICNDEFDFDKAFNTEYLKSSNINEFTGTSP